MSAAPELRVRAIVVDDDRLLMLRRRSDSTGGGWAVPGGLVRSGELLAEAVVRTVLDETGVEAVCGELLGTSEQVEPGRPHRIHLAYRVGLLESVEPVAGDDAAEARWVELGEVSDLVLAPGLAELLHDHEIIATFT